MAGKRLASNELNHTNWNDEEDPEESGTFQQAPNEVIKSRVIKVAKRRNPISSRSSESGDEKKSVFSTFSGFSKGTAGSSSFDFLSNLTKKPEEEPKTNGIGNTNKLTAEPVKQADNENKEKYLAKLKGLNESVSKWIKQHVDANPFLNLSPIFKDYEKYFDEIEKSKGEKIDLKETISKRSQTNVPGIGSFVFKPQEKIVDTQKPLPEKPTDTQKPTPEKPTFIFGSANHNTAPTTQMFSFGNASKGFAPTGTGFGGAKPFSFSNVTKEQPTEENKTEKEDEEDEPPKVEFTPVVEQGHVYTARCKVFVKKDGNFGDRGVGTLYLKPVPNSEKVQLIVRADTSLGNLLCNFILSASIPTQRVGKRDVMVIAIPTPDASPTSILFRVKSEQVADELLSTLKKYKK